MRRHARLFVTWRTALQEAARIVQERSGRDLSFVPEWRALTRSQDERPAVAAVDGSHAVLVDTGAVWVVATRATAVRWPGAIHPEVPVQISAAGPEEGKELVAAQYQARGLEPPPVAGAESFAEALRSLAEFEATRDALANLPTGGLVLLDGALERLPKLAAALVERLLESAERHHVGLIGVAKRSRLESGGVPLVAALRRLGLDAMPEKAWAVPVPDHTMAHVALLHPRSKHAFRVDTTDPAALADLLPLCQDAVYTGYPYPLAVAHNAVAISGAAARNLRARLGDEVRLHGGDAWHLVDDFHDVLDRNAPR